MICTNVFRLSAYTLLAFALACSPASRGDQSDWSKLDLMPYGIPIEITAPDSARVNVTRVGEVEDVAVRNEGKQPFSVQIFVQPLLLNDMAALKFNQINEVRSNPEFGKIVEEDEQGFIFSSTIWTAGSATISGMYTCRPTGSTCSLPTSKGAFRWKKPGRCSNPSGSARGAERNHVYWQKRRASLNAFHRFQPGE